VVFVTTNLGIALDRARMLRQSLPPDALGQVWLTAWADGPDHCFAYVDLATGNLFDYDQSGRPYAVTIDQMNQPLTDAPMPEVWVEDEEMT